MMNNCGAPEVCVFRGVHPAGDWVRGGMSPVAHGDLPQTEKLPLAEVGRKENMPLYASKKRLK